MTHVAEIGKVNTSYWSHYFPNATIVRLNVTTSFVGLDFNKSDMIIDHGSVDHQKNLHALWDYVRPGGFYVMEFPIDSLPTTSSRGLEYLHHPEQLNSLTQNILQNNFPFFVDTSIGRLEWGIRLADSNQPQSQQQRSQSSQKQRENHQQPLVQQLQQRQKKPPPQQLQEQQQLRNQQLKLQAIQHLHDQQQKYHNQRPHRQQQRRRLRQCAGIFDWAWSMLTGLFVWTRSDLTLNCNWQSDSTHHVINIDPPMGETITTTNNTTTLPVTLPPTGTKKPTTPPTKTTTTKTTTTTTTTKAKTTPVTMHKGVVGEMFGKNRAASFCIVIRKRIGSPPPIKNIGGSTRVPYLETISLSE